MSAPPDRSAPLDPVPGLVSIVMAAYDEAEFIAEAIASVHAQSYDQWELIVVDDGSSEATAAIAADLGATVVRQPHRGHPFACNAGFARVRGEYWTLFDADDVMPPDRLRHQTAYLATHPEHDLVLGLTEAFTTPGQPPAAHWDPRWEEGPFAACAGTTLARRSLLHSVGLFDESLAVSADVDWLSRAQESGARAGQLEELCLHYRIHPGNTSGDRAAVHRVLLTLLRGRVRRHRASLTAD
jgi:glycosyltransferase involved in cell wall biosynthesis